MRTALQVLLAAGVALTACGGSDPSRIPATIVPFSGDHQTGTAGAPLGQPLQVQVTDKDGNGVSGARVTFTTGAGAGSVAPATVTTNRQGVASATWTLGTAAGVGVTATATVSGVGAPAQFSATVHAAAPSTMLLLQGDSQVADAGQALALPIRVRALDAFGNPVAGQVVGWVITGGAGTLQAADGITDAQGEAGTGWTLGYQIGPVQALRAQVGGASANLSATALLPAGVTLAIGSGDAQIGEAGHPLAAALGVRVRAAGGQDLANVPIDWAVLSGGGSVAQPATLTNALGLATVTWTLGPGVGGQSLSAGNPGLTPATVTLSATAIVPPASTITGTVSLVDTQLSAIRIGRSMSRRWAGARATGEGVLRPRFAAPRQTDYIPDELIVRLTPTASGVGGGVRAMVSVQAARTAATQMRNRLAAYVLPGRAAITGVSPVIRSVRLRFSSAQVADSMARVLAADPGIEAVGRNMRARIDGAPLHPGTVPNDPNFPNQSWHYGMVGLPQAWSTTTGSSSVIVAVLDNGIRFDHPAIGVVGGTASLAGGNLRNDGYDFVSLGTAPLCGGGTVDNTADGDGYDLDPTIPDDRDASDPSGCLGGREQLGAHGLHVAGTIGALGNDGLGVTGENWSVSIRPVRVLGMNGGNYFDIAQGVLYASGLPADDGAGGQIAPPATPARIINLSLGGACPTGADPLHAAITAATDPGRPNGGVLVVASAGNAASSVPSCPAFYDEVLAVGAVGPDATRASYSNFGSWVDIAAPGGETAAPDGTFGIFSTVCDFTGFPAPCGPTYARYFGTSMASPHVAGIAALLLAQNPALTPAQLRSRLLTYATPLAPGQQLGAGIVNARAALAQSTTIPRSIRVRAVDAATGTIVAEVAAPGGNYRLGGLPDGSYYVVAGEDEAGDGFIGAPDRRFGAYGGISSPTAVSVSSAAGGFASFAVGYPVEQEPNNTAAGASLLQLEGAVQGTIDLADPIDYYRIRIPSAGTYSFETTGWFGNFCSYALDVNTTLTLLDQNQVEQAANADIAAASNNYCSRLTLSLTPGTYYLTVTPGDFFGTGPHSGRYILTARSGP